MKESTPRRHPIPFVPNDVIKRQHTRARTALWNAIKCGYIERASACQDCGSDDRVEAHHHDYSKPLEVQWLCKSCHYAHHGSRPR